MEPRATPDGGVKFACSNCGQHIVADMNQIGSTAACPSCGHNVTVPAGDRVSATATQQSFKPWVMSRWKRMGRILRIYLKKLASILKFTLNKFFQLLNGPKGKRLIETVKIYCEALLLVLRKRTQKESVPKKLKQLSSAKWKGLKRITQIGWISLAVGVFSKFFFNSGDWLMVLTFLIGVIALLQKPRLQAIVLLIACLITPFKYYKRDTYEASSNASQESTNTGESSDRLGETREEEENGYLLVLRMC